MVVIKAGLDPSGACSRGRESIKVSLDFIPVVFERECWIPNPQQRYDTKPGSDRNESEMRLPRRGYFTRVWSGRKRNAQKTEVYINSAERPGSLLCSTVVRSPE